MKRGVILKKKKENTGIWVWTKVALKLGHKHRNTSNGGLLTCIHIALFTSLYVELTISCRIYHHSG